jgi:glycosyltransferase involved in cell wall biosynthesis
VGANLIYHEHDSPSRGSLHPWLGRLRAAAARSAQLVIFPNEERARIAEAELELEPSRRRIIWNTPCRAELPPLQSPPQPPLIIYYHGSITPDRLPESVIEAVHRFHGRVRLKIAGYEAAGANGYVARLLALGRARDGEPLVDYAGQIPQISDLLNQAARAHVGLALMPLATDDVNMRNMTGASNKPFDYMAAGLALLVSNLSDWKTMFVDPGFGLACDPTDADSVSMALAWFVDHPEARRAMAARGRNKIEADWNYDTQFRTVLESLELRR